MDYALFVIIGAVGAFASAIFGFGTALLVIALGSHVIPIKDAIALGTVLFAASTITKTALFARHIDWKLAGIIAIGCLPFAYLGAELLAVAPAEMVKRLLGIAVLAYLALGLVGRLPSVPIGPVGLAAGAAVYGFVSGFLGSGNLVKVVLFRELRITKEAFVGAMAATSILSNVAKLASYAHTGLLRPGMAWPAVILAVSAVVAAILGKLVLRQIRVETFDLGVKVLLGVAAAALVI